MSNAAKTAENARIRDWARERGMNVSDSGRISPAIRERFKLYEAGQDPEEPGYRGDDDGGDQGDGAGTLELDGMPSRESVPQASPEASPAGVVEPFVSRETPPRGPAPARGIRGLRDRAVGRGVAAVKGKRVSLASLAGGAWGLAARVLAVNPQQVPVSRVLQLQAPVAGVMVERMAKDTIVDRLLQPLARAGEKGEAVMALFGPPLLVAAITNRPDLFPLLRPLLAEALDSWMDIAGPEIKRQRERAEKRKAEGIDVDAIIMELFAPIVEQEAGADGHAAEAA